MFLAEYLDEVYHKNSVKYIQLYSDISQYQGISDIPKSHQDFILYLTKSDLPYMAFITGISVYEATLIYFELDAKYTDGILTAEEFAKELDTEILKRMLG